MARPLGRGIASPRGPSAWRKSARRGCAAAEKIARLSSRGSPAGARGYDAWILTRPHAHDADAPAPTTAAAKGGQPNHMVRRVVGDDQQAALLTTAPVNAPRPALAASPTTRTSVALPRSGAR